VGANWRDPFALIGKKEAVVGRQTRKLNVATFPANFTSDTTIDITEADWIRIEEAFQRPLSPEVRTEVFNKTLTYLMFAPGEAFAETVPTARRKLDDALKHGRAFVDAVYLLGNSHASQLVDEHFNKRFGSVQEFNLFFEMMQVYLEACELALRHINDPVNHGWPRGGTWANWIRSLTKTARTYGLPYEARCDSDKNATEKSSPFVAFVRELQRCLPRDFQGRVRSDGALATAIKRARKSARVR
jgi:hypothetical protein